MKHIFFFIFFSSVYFFLLPFLSNTYAQYGGYRISGNVFEDYSGDYFRQSGEPVLHHIGSFTILPSNLAVIEPGTWSYQVLGAPNGTAVNVYYTLAPGYVPVFPNTNGSAPNYYSYYVATVGPNSCNVGSGTTVGATCLNGNISNLNFIVKRTNLIRTRVFQDVNNNGTYEIDTDNPLWSQSVSVRDNSGAPLDVCINSSCSCSGDTCTATTDTEGLYFFGPLYKGSYIVTFNSLPASSLHSDTPSPATVTVP